MLYMVYVICAGTGSFGRVRLVRSRKAAQYLALKAVKIAQLVKHKQVDHVLNEKAVLATVQHPFIVNL
jgi:serine/threonine protein kinase